MSIFRGRWFIMYLFLSLLASPTSSSPRRYHPNDLLQQNLTVTMDGIQISNEFQLINHHRIANPISPTRNLKLTEVPQYDITGVSPLAIRNNDLVKVSFKSSLPVATDWIAAYSADADLKLTVPIKFALCGSDPFYEHSGSGYLYFNFTNTRNDIMFKYFTGSLEEPVLVAEFSDLLRFENVNEPLRPRIVPVGSNDPDTFKLLWSSAISSNPTLRWGTQSGAYTTNVYAETQRIDRSHLCGAPANATGWRDLGMIHTAYLKGMMAQANKKIYYSFGDSSTNDFSKEYVFNVPPVRGSQPRSRPTRVILYDDLGRGSSDDSYTWNEYGRPSYYTALAVGAEVNNGQIDAVYHGGDISYASGYAAVWDHFLNMISPIASSVLYLTTVGNHESDSPNSSSFYKGDDSGGECGIIATTLLPQPAPATAAKPWWSYDIGIIHFVGMSTEHDFRIGSEQYAWLDADLALVNRELTPWVIFGGHRPMYVNSGYSDMGVPADMASPSDKASGPAQPIIVSTSGDPTAMMGTMDMERASGDIEVMNMLIKHVEPLLMKHQVNVAFYGHNHVVQRHSAVYQKKTIQRSTPVLNDDGDTVNLFRDPEATVHMVIGTAGAAFTQNAVDPPPDWNELCFYKWGYARVTAVNSTYLSWDWVESATGTVWDRMAIQQTDNWADKPKWTNAKPLITKDTKANKRADTYNGIKITDFAAFFAGGFVVAAFIVFFLLECVYSFFSGRSNEYKVVRIADVPYVHASEYKYNEIP